jgi:hypothetical protein
MQQHECCNTRPDPIAGLDAPSESDIQELWLCQARRRAAEIDTGRVNLISSEQLELQVQALFK